MQKKDLADTVFFNVSFSDKSDEAIAIYQGKILDIGTIPYIFSNYRGFVDYNAQGFYIRNLKENSIEIGESANQIVITTQQEVSAISSEQILWEIVGENCVERNLNHLDPHWDDH